jgi:nucleolar pre-ribosomal-associated protein 1
MQTMLFQHDEHEVDLWLESISTRKRAPDACAPDGTPLTDESTALVSFMDDCVQRCMKASYRYLEELQGLWFEGSLPSQYVGLLPSPLLMTMIEQLEAKWTRSLLSPSDCLAAVTYLRRVMLRLAAKVQTLQPLHNLAKRLATLFSNAGPSPIVVGINHEVQALSQSLTQLERPSAIPSETNHAANAFLQTLSGKKIRASQLLEVYI